MAAAAGAVPVPIAKRAPAAKHDPPKLLLARPRGFPLQEELRDRV